MKFAFFGSSDFSVLVLRKLILAGFIPSAVICNPDRPVGRTKILASPLTKHLADEHGIPVFQPEKITEEVWRARFGQTEFDFFIIAAYAKIIPANVLALARQGALGVHPSLLPRFRGASPIQTVILEGEQTTGVTLFLMDQKVDHGPILAQSEPIPVDLAFYKDLEADLALVAGDLLVSKLPEFSAGTLVPVLQDESTVTMTKKFSTEDAFVSEGDLKKAAAGDLVLASSIERKIRALTPEPGVWTIAENMTFGNIHVSGKRVKLLEALVKDGALIVTYIQIEGKNPIRL